jgi:SSS family solute:Na+ symporter
VGEGGTHNSLTSTYSLYRSLYLMIVVAVIFIPIKLGGWGEIFAQVPQSKLVLPPEQYAGYSTLALGSALALFLYPHAITAIFDSSS